MSVNIEQHWSFGVGDPTIGGWLTTGLYFLAALSAFWVYRRADVLFTLQTKRQRILWLLFTLALLTLGLNKQLDLHILLIDKARVLSHWQGWYDHRRLVQVGFIKSSAVLSVILVGTFVLLFRQVLKRHLLAIAGLCLLAAYAIIRVTVFQTPDVLWWHFRFGFQINWLLECIGLILILVNAHRLLKPHFDSHYQPNRLKS